MIRPHRARRATLVLAAVLLVSACGEGDPDPDVGSVGQLLREQPGVRAVDEFFSGQQLKVAESYEADALMSWHATAAQACALVPLFFEGIDQADLDPRIMNLKIRHSSTQADYPYPWSLELNARRGDPTELEEACLELQRLRGLPPGSTVASYQRDAHTEVRIRVPAEAVADVHEAQELVAEILELDPDTLEDKEQTGFDVRIGVSEPVE